MRVAMAGLDTLTTSSHATHASRAVGASIIERVGFLKLCRNPKFIAYVVVLVYSMARAVPVMYVPHFRGDWRILWAIDMITAIPYTWGLIEMVAGQKLWHRIVGAATAAVTFLAPYVYFLMYGRHAPRASGPPSPASSSAGSSSKSSATGATAPSRRASRSRAQLMRCRQQ